jgi:hypothetical protein
VRASYVVYANVRSGIDSLYHFSLYENICLSYKTSSLACNYMAVDEMPVDEMPVDEMAVDEMNRRNAGR